MDDQGQDVSGAGFVFKVLGGSLHGIEFSLEAQDYFIYVGDGQAQQDSLAMAERTLHIPGSTAADNFIVHLSSPAPGEQFEVTVCRALGQETLALAFNSVCEVEGVYFAIRPVEQSWSDAVRQGVPVPVKPGRLAGPSEPEVELQRPQISTSGPAGRIMRYAGLVLVLGLVAAAGWRYTGSRGPDPVVASTDELQKLVGNRPGYSLHLGKGGVKYLFASNLIDSQWVQQALAREKHVSHWRVVTSKSEVARLSTVLEQNNIAFYSIRLNDPAHPVLLLSSTRSRIDAGGLDQIKQLFLDAAPYASDLTIQLFADEQVLDKAEQGLKAMGIEYQVLQSESAVTLSTWIPSADVDLNVFSRFVSDFYQNWGQHYVKFSVDIHEDSMKGKSFKYGQEGVVTMNKSHWSFQKPRS